VRTGTSIVVTTNIIQRTGETDSRRVGMIMDAAHLNDRSC
jgi:hypothetical protein